MIKVNEIFFSIQGESTFCGFPTVFVRTTSCNLRCTYCDTKYSYYEGSTKTVENIIEEIKIYPAKFVCITGGEPLLQVEIFQLMTELCNLGYKVSLETSGSKSIQKVDPRVKVILDVKTPDSGARDSFLMENLQYIRVDTEIKFVICSRQDFFWSENFCKAHNLFHRSHVLYSPSFEEIPKRELAELILKNGSEARLQLQMHKYIWEPTTRGV